MARYTRFVTYATPSKHKGVVGERRSKKSFRKWLRRTKRKG